MDDSTSTNNLQIEPKDGCHPGDCVGSTVTRLPSASDENENQLDGDGCEHLTSSDSAMGKPEVLEQDSLNNNESCTADCEAAPSENSESASWEGPRDGQAFLGRDKKTPARRSSRSRRSTAGKGLSSGDITDLRQEDVPSAATLVVSEEPADVNANDQAEAPRLALQPLFSLIRGEVEQLDSRALPLCLHQIAESYFQEEDYEKAMKFIQLERLYHERLLANLSAIQEQWEIKWKTVQPHSVTSLKNSEKGFNGEDFERLTKFCTTHQDPLLSKHKIAAVLERKSITQLLITVSEEPQERGATAKEPERSACLGMDPGSDGQHKETLESAPSRDQQAGPQSPGMAHEEEPLGSARATLALPAQPAAAAAAARSRSGPHCAGNACEAAGSPPAPTDGCQGLIATGDAAADPESVLSSESMREPLVLPGSEHLPPAPLPEGRCAQTARKELRLALEDASQALPTSQPENNELNEPRQPELTDSDGKSTPGPADSPETRLCENGKAADLSAALPELPMAPEGKGDQIDPVNKETEDYLNSLLEGCLKDAEDSFSYEDNQEEDSDLLQDLSPEEASYSLQENLPPDDSCLSLDDLAKRIEIAEVVPAEGLVSILKKRNDTLGDHPAQMQQKPSKRRVRFQEIDDHLDQDEVGGGSCVLLILLCVVTVFLSVGGTALYCSFGDMESPVCTDFADNVDFYYAKLLQGMAELKHWVYLS